MSGMQQALMGGGGVAVAIAISNINDIRATPVTATGSLTLNGDGSVTYVGGGAGGSPTWATPVQAGNGALFWVRLVVNAGPNPSGSAVNTVLSLVAGQGWSWIATAGQVKSGNCTITIYSDAGGVNAVSTDGFTFDVEST